MQQLLSASLAISTSILKALPGKLDIKRHSPSILYLLNYMSNHLKIVNEELESCDSICVDKSLFTIITKSDELMLISCG